MRTEIFALDQFPIQIKCGGSHSALITNGGFLYTWGSGACGATGLGHNSPSFEPAAPIIRGFNPEDVFIKQVSCGKSGTAVVT